MKSLLVATLVTQLSSLLISPTDPHLYFSEQNWVVNDTVAFGVNPGSYLKLAFTNSSAVNLTLQANDASCTSDCDYLSIAYSVDNGERLIQRVLSNSTHFALASKLSDDASPDRPHTLELFIYNSVQHNNRWTDPGHHGGAALLVKGVELDAGAVTVAPTLRPRRALFFGDSITEGVAAQCKHAASCTSTRATGDLCGNAATKTWGPAVAAALGAEYSQVGFGGLGWVVPGGGGVVPFFTPGNATLSSWGRVWAGAPPRSFAGLDYVFVLHATNDGLRGAAGPVVAASVAGWLAATREAVGPRTAIFLTVPFGGFGGPNQPVGALRAGFEAYQASVQEAAQLSALQGPGPDGGTPEGGTHDSSTPEGGTPDPQTFFVDLGREAAIGLECFAGAAYAPAYGSRCGRSAGGCGGIHPRGGTGSVARHGELGAMLATKAVLAIMQQGR
jgi:hypothetical protein